MRVALVCCLIVALAAGASAARVRGSSVAFDAADDAALLDASGAGAAGVDVDSLGALRDAISDDLSSDSSSLSDTLDRLLTGSQVDEVAGEAYGDEALTDAHTQQSTTTQVSVTTDTTHTDEELEASVPSASAAIENAITEITGEPTRRSSGVIPAPRAPPTTVTAETLMHFKAVSDSAAANAAAAAAAAAAAGKAADPITPLKGTPTKVAVPVPGPLPAVSTDAEADAPRQHHAKAHGGKKHAKHAADDEEEEDEEQDNSHETARFLAQKAMSAAIARFAAQDDPNLTPQQRALASQGGTDPAAKATATYTPATTERIKSAVYVVLAIGAVVALVEASSYLTDYALQRVHVQVDRMLAKTYRALMLLGLVSFLAICFARLGWLSHMFGEYSPTLLYDLVIVMGTMGVLYLVVMAGLVGYVLYKAAAWRTIELKHRTEADLTRLENALTKQRDEYNARSCCWRTWACVDRYNLNEVEFEAHYLQIKQQFVRQHHRRFFAPYATAAMASAVPPVAEAAAAAANHPSPAVSYQNFEFHAYLRKSMQQVMEEVAAVHWQVWVVVLSVVLLNALRMLAFKAVDASSFVYLSVVALWLVLVFAAVLFYSLLHVTEELADHYTLYLPDRESLVAPGADAANGSAVAALAGRDVVAPSDDPDDELLREAHHIQGGGHCGACCSCCTGCRALECCSAPTKQQSLFACRTPSSVTKGVQLAVLLTCLVVPAYIVDMRDFVAASPNAVRYSLNVLLFVPPLVMLLFMVPAVLPRFLLATSVASMSRLSALRQTVIKLNSSSYRTAKLDADKKRRAAAAAAKAGGAVNAGSAGAVVSSLHTDFADDRSLGALSDEDDDDSDVENDAASQRSDIEIQRNNAYSRVDFKN